MRIIVSGIPEDGLEQNFSLPVVIGDKTHPDVVSVSMQIFRMGKKVLIRGSIDTAVTLKCGRCLEQFKYPLSVKFTDEYNPADEQDKSREYELSGGELDLSYYQNDEIDVSDLIKEQILLSVPMKPLCTSECSGICPQCGKNLNEGLCMCGPKKIDSRLEPLMKLKAAMKDRKE